MACPDLLHTSANTILGLGTWDGGTKISLRLSTGFLATYSYPDFTFLYSNAWSGAITGDVGSVVNMAVDDDGFAYIWIRKVDSIYRLYKYDIAGHTATEIYVSGYTSTTPIDGPSWNPYDGYLYEVIDAGGGVYELTRWDTSGGGPTVVDTFTRTYGFTRGNPVFTADGSIWFDIEDGGVDGYVETVRYSGGSFSAAPEFFAQSPVPRTSDSVWSAHLGGQVLHAGGSSEATDCPLFETDGTARVHCGVGGVVTFLYPTSGGAGNDVYGFTIPADTGGWTVGSVGWG